jgi:hypothetical protein
VTYLTKEQCEHGKLYRIHSRNLKIGVYNSRTGGFCGLRTKFGSVYVFEEYHWDNGSPYGTVKPQELIPETLLEGIYVAEYLPELLCNGGPVLVSAERGKSACGRPLKSEHDDKYLHEHLDGVPCDAGAKVYGAFQSNTALYDWLVEMEKKYPSSLDYDPR